MKKVLFFVALATVFAGCSSDEFTPEPGQLTTTDSAIMFGPKKTNAHKVGDKTGEDAATALGMNFVVEGVKTKGTTTSVVFDHYNVNYTASTANTTESNTANWEYVGIGKHGLSQASEQTIKYWDYSASQYDFVAFSYGKSNYVKSVLTKINYANLGKAVDATGRTNAVYTVTGKTDELVQCYLADLVTLYNKSGEVTEYGQNVTPNFRSMGTKVRVAFYETVPGYSVKNVKFYSEAWDESTKPASSAAPGEYPDNATLFTANAFFPGVKTEGTMSVYYPTVGWGNKADADYNQAHVKFEAGTGDKALVTTKTFGALQYNAGLTEESGDEYLGRTKATATYAGGSSYNYYQVVLPLGHGENLQLRIEYDLVSTDGSGETIHVRDARAVVPAAYADWKPNYAYTYIFKISDKTNGWTGVDKDGNVVEGLTPITFDAVVVDDQEGNQETITTVSTPSITTYQKGVAITNNEYKTGNVYASVMNSDATAVTLTTSNCCFYEVTGDDKDKATEAIIKDLLNGVKSPTGIELSSKGATVLDAIPGADTADGNPLTVEGKVAKLDVYSGHTYVFCYWSASGAVVKLIKVNNL